MMKQPKILYVASTSQHLRRFHRPYIDALRQENEVYLMATAGEGIHFPLAFAKSFFSLSNFKTIFQIRKILKKERFDRVILNTSLSAFLVRFAMFGIKNRPYVLNIVHGYLFSRPIKGLKARILLFCEQLLKNKTDEIAVMNEEDFQITQNYRLCHGRVSFLRGMGYTLSSGNGVPNMEMRRRYAGDNDFVCCFVGELSARKNQLFLVRATSRLVREGYPIRLLLLGEGSERNALEAEISRLGMQSHIFLLGNQEPILPYLQITDLYVSASISEGLPFNVMEAMECGLPLLLSDCKGQNDLLKGHPQMLYPLQNEDAFCDSFKELYRSGLRGIGTCQYPNLEAYTLSAVWDVNLKLLTGERIDEIQA